VKLRLLIVDDNAHFLEAARDLLEREGLDVVAVASTGADAVRLSRLLRPDVTLVDVDLGQESGFDVARQVTDGGPVVIISTYAEQDLSDLIDASPAIGYLSKFELSGRAISELLDGPGDRRG
jgi:DNA-binding NarL/FixJ family response regulator